MKSFTILVLADLQHELGRELDRALERPDLPALPRLVDRLLDEPAGATYVCSSFQGAHHGRPGQGPNNKKKAKAAIIQAKQQGHAALVVLLDRDRAPKPLPDKFKALRDGRDEYASASYPPCAVGMAIETFDAWMIADGSAIKQAGGDPTKGHFHPETLDGVEGTGRHPKEFAKNALGDGLSDKYMIVATRVDLALLARQCPKGFAPFAKEVRDRIGQALPQAGGSQ